MAFPERRQSDRTESDRTGNMQGCGLHRRMVRRMTEEQG